MAVKMPLSTGGPVQAVKPLPGGIDGTPVTISGTSASTQGIQATGTIVFADNPTALDTITMNGVVFTFVASGATGNEINIAVSLDLTLDNVISVLNGSSDPAVNIATYTENGVDTLTITFDAYSRDGNLYTLAASADTVSGPTLTGGTGGASGSALYIMADIPCHIRFDGQAATVNDAPLPANVPMVFACNLDDNVSVIQATGQTGGLLYVHNVEEV